jgi:hypothetical protein
MTRSRRTVSLSPYGRGTANAPLQVVMAGRGIRRAGAVSSPKPVLLPDYRAP